MQIWDSVNITATETKSGAATREFECKFCGHQFRGGGSRLLGHIAGGQYALHAQIRSCTMPSIEIKRLAIDALEESTLKKIVRLYLCFFLSFCLKVKQNQRPLALCLSKQSKSTTDPRVKRKKPNEILKPDIPDDLTRIEIQG